ncbi:MAG: hypothetical protein C0594_06960 [Marinilabiliales bacterium]|mgnify:CR=1 FL=1|nr:MAG: hypothetical protein C0594_06960 [Marinilabiliales bacterium]
MEKTGAIIIEGHVQGLSNTRALGEKGVPVYVVDTENCIARYSKYCRKFFKCPEYKSKEFIKFLIDLANREKINNWLLYPSNDHAVFNLAKNKALLSKFYTVITPDVKIIDNIYNKEMLIKSAYKSDVPVPDSWFPQNYKSIQYQSYKYPLLVKGKFGLNFYKTTGKKAFLCKDENELEKTISAICEVVKVDDLIIQNLLNYGTNKTISLGAFCIDGEMHAHWIGEKVREHPYSFGTSTFSRSITNETIYEQSKKLLKKLNYSGICEVEFLLDESDQRYKLIEINARTWLWVELAKTSGINLAWIAYEYFVKGEQRKHNSYQSGKEWMHYITDIPFSFFGIIKRKYSLGNIVRSFMKLPSPAVFQWKDIVPFFAELFLLPLLIIKR